MKTRTLLIAAVLLLAFSAAAFAQATYTVGSIPVTTVIKTGNAEKAGDITFSQVPGSAASVAGTISITYGTGVNITSDFADVTVTGTGAYAGLAGLTVNTLASTNNPGLLVINVPATISSGSFTVSGVRVQISGTTVTALNASLTSTGNAIVAGQTVVQVITSVADGLGAVEGDPVTGIGVNALNGNIDAGTSPVTVTVKEGFLAAWTPGVGVRVTLSSLPPKGVSINMPGTLTSYSLDADGNQVPASTFLRGNSLGGGLSSTGTTITSSSKSSTLSQYYYVATDAGDTVLETLPIVITATSPTATDVFPLPTLTITAAVSLAPIAPAFNSDGTLADLPIPRFDRLDSTAVNVLAITGRTTALLMPYVSLGGGFDTGIAISNTTEDPGAALLGVANGAFAQSGKITFYFFPQGASTLPVITYQTSATSAGSGLDANGSLVSGGTYVVLLSQLLAAAGQPATFNGYAIAVTQFTNAHGIFVLSNFTTFGQSALMQVLSDRLSVPERLGN